MARIERRVGGLMNDDLLEHTIGIVEGGLAGVD